MATGLRGRGVARADRRRGEPTRQVPVAAAGARRIVDAPGHVRVAPLRWPCGPARCARSLRPRHDARRLAPDRPAALRRRRVVTAVDAGAAARLLSVSSSTPFRIQRLHRHLPCHAGFAPQERGDQARAAVGDIVGRRGQRRLRGSVRRTASTPATRRQRPQPAPLRAARHGGSRARWRAPSSSAARRCATFTTRAASPATFRAGAGSTPRRQLAASAGRACAASSRREPATSATLPAPMKAIRRWRPRVPGGCLALLPAKVRHRRAQA